MPKQGDVMMKVPISILATTLLMSGTSAAQFLDIPEEIPEVQPETIEPSLESNQPVDESPTAQGKLLVEPNFDLAPVQNEALGESSPLYYDDEMPAPGLSIKIPTD
jgi:hypothetical protein